MKLYNHHDLFSFSVESGLFGFLIGDNCNLRWADALMRWCGDVVMRWYGDTEIGGDNFDDGWYSIFKCILFIFIKLDSLIYLSNKCIRSC
jgi:hypothetical protein